MRAAPANDVDVLAKIMTRRLMSRDELLPYAYVRPSGGQDSGLATLLTVILYGSI